MVFFDVSISSGSDDKALKSLGIGDSLSTPYQMSRRPGTLSSAALIRNGTRVVLQK